MKKNILIYTIFIFIIVILLVLCILFAFDIINLNSGKIYDKNVDENILNDYNNSDLNNNNNNDDINSYIQLPIKLQGEIGLTEITYYEYYKKIEKDEPFLVIIKREACGYCELFEPIIKEVAEEYKIPISYINLTNLTIEERNLLAESNTYLRKNQWGTPTTLFLYGDTVVDSIGGYIDKESFVEFVKENFIIEY